MKNLIAETLNSVISAYGPPGLFLVMTIQTIIAPIPSEALLIFSGIIGISLFNIVFFGGSGLIFGSVIAFFVGRHGGKPLVEKILGKKWIGLIDKWVERNGAKSILLMRLIPLVPFDFISYISGMTSLKFRSYFLATVLGAYPRCFILALMGSVAKGFFELMGLGIELTILIGVIGIVILAYLDKKGYLGFLENSVVGKTIKSRLNSSKETKKEIS